MGGGGSQRGRAGVSGGGPGRLLSAGPGRCCPGRRAASFLPGAGRPASPSLTPSPGARVAAPPPPARPPCPRLPLRGLQQVPPGAGSSRRRRSAPRARPGAAAPARHPRARVRPHEDRDPAAPAASPPRFLPPSRPPARGPGGGRARARPPPRHRPAALRAMDAPEQQPEPDGGDAPGHEPGGSPQDEFDFSILFDYEYLNPIEGRWRLLPAWPHPEPGRGLGPAEWARGPSLVPMSPFPGGPAGREGCVSPGEREGMTRLGRLPPLGGGRLTLAR